MREIEVKALVPTARLDQLIGSGDPTSSEIHDMAVELILWRRSVERKAEPVAWLFEGDGWGREVTLSRQEALDRKDRLSRTWDIEITPLYAAALSASPSPVDSRDGLEAATVKALENARTQILSAYRVWVADDIAAFPPPKTQAGEVIAQIDAILAAKEQQP